MRSRQLQATSPADNATQRCPTPDGDDQEPGAAFGEQPAGQIERSSGAGLKRRDPSAIPADLTGTTIDPAECRRDRVEKVRRGQRST